MTGSKQKKDQEVERLTAELNALRIELATCKGLLQKQTKDYNVKVEELRVAEDEIDELKKLLEIAKAIRRKSVAQLRLPEEDIAAQEDEVPDGCKTS